MNNFVFSQDPLLYSTIMSKQVQQPQEYEMRRQLDEAMAQYQAMTQNQQQNQKQTTRDYLGEIDEMVRTLDSDVAASLMEDLEYVKLNTELQKMVQDEMMKSIRWKINSNPEAISKMDRLKDMITNAKKIKIDEDRKVMADINDYIKNFSDLTFDEYKKLKYSKQ